MSAIRSLPWRSVGFILAGLLLLGALLVVSRGTRPPAMPADAAHAGLSANETCTPCHGKGSPHPLNKDHPPKEDCVYCHARAKAP